MKNCTVKQRISIGFTIVIAVTAVVGIVGVFSLRAISALSAQLVEKDMPGALIMATMKDNLSQGYAYVERHIRAGDEAMMRDTEERYLRLFEANQQQIAAYRKLLDNDEARNAFARLEDRAAAYAVVRKEAFRLSMTDKAQAVAYMQEVFLPEYRKYRASFDEVLQWNMDRAEATSVSTRNKVKEAMSIIIVSLLFAVGAAIASAVMIVRKTNGILCKAITSLNEGSSQLAAAAAEVSSASNSLAQGASEQAASLEETSSSLEEMSSMTANNAESARKAKGIAEEMRKAADDSSEQMHQMQTAMDAIKESSAGISQIIKTIDEIAFQTNILALNAAVEAARAGEAGAGFAIVADEVRSLAQRSAKSAKETSAKIEGAVRNSEQGVQISSKVATSLGSILDKARTMNSLVGEIAQATEEQNRGIAELSKAVTQIDQITQSSASNAEETAAASEELNANADSLQDTVTELLSLVQKSVESSAGAAGSTHRLVGIGPAQQPQRLPSAPAAPRHKTLLVHRTSSGKFIT
ncbi:MAG TPA: methyl-accepting chemotaxis protein [Opitutales bacterium]|nr:methyl-accepting chemotaxis protein [Opitutales bacterium]